MDLKNYNFSASGFSLRRAFSRCIGPDGVSSFVAIIEFGRSYDLKNYVDPGLFYWPK